MRTLAIVPAFNEERAIAGVIDELRAFDPSFAIVVIDDCSEDATAAVAEANGVHVIRLPFNLGIGGAVQTGFKYALANGYELAVRVDGDGQHDPVELVHLIPPVVDGTTDICVGSRFAGADGYRSSGVRRVGIRILARTVSLLTGQRVTDTTSGFQALNARAIALFAEDYPHDYPEVEAAVLLHKRRLRRIEMPVRMREREHGTSSITTLHSVYYMIKVMLAILVAMLRRHRELEDA
jgi:glycosyltransferase involved in cell wall biosynthesis